MKKKHLLQIVATLLLAAIAIDLRIEAPGITLAITSGVLLVVMLWLLIDHLKTKNDNGDSR